MKVGGAAGNIAGLGLSPFGQSPSVGTSQRGGQQNYHAGQEKLKAAANFNSTIKEVTGEMFYTKYGNNQFSKNRTSVEGREKVQ